MATKLKNSGGFNAVEWGRDMRAGRLDDSEAPPDTESRRLTCTVAGASPRFVNAEGSFAIWSASYEHEGKTYGATIKGDLARVNPGEMLACEGKWKKHEQYGWSFQVFDYRSSLPDTADGVALWLERRVDGVGPTFAKAIVKHFGHDKVYDVLDADPTKLRDVRTEKGRKLPAKQVEKAIEAWDEAKAIRQIETFLFSHGVTSSLAGKLYRQYGPDVVKVLTDTPYRITEMRGIGFKVADKVAVSMGTKLNDPYRIMCAILYVLDEAEGQGHTFLALQQMVGHTVDALKPPSAGKNDAPPQEVRDPTLIVECASKLSAAGRIVVEDDEHLQQRVYSKRLHRMETQLAQRVRHLLGTPGKPLFAKPEMPTAPEGATPEEVEKLRLPTEEQWGAVDFVRTQRLAMLTGGPGVGKTQTTKTLVNMLTENGRQVKLCAPTGKAARRMQELTGHPATTIHRLLEFSPQDGGFQRDESNPIEADCVILDEASMLALDLAHDFFRAIGENTHVLLVGDPDQLAPVGAGKVLDDLITTQVVPRVHLSRIFRQSAKSMIVQNARRINTGNFPYMRKEEAEAALGQRMDDDFFWVTRKTAAETAELVLDLTVNKLPRAFGLDPVKDIMVLAPMRDGQVGLHYLNSELEKRLNTDASGQPKKPIISRKYKLAGRDVFENICVGSRIVQTKNDYTPQREIMNGELAIVLQHDEDKKECLLSLDDGLREVWVPVPDMDTFYLAWALTTHKSQGSEFKAVVCPVSTAHFNMLNRALYYTAVTRAKQKCVMVGEKKALAIAVKNPDMKKRNSTLAARVTEPAMSGELF